MWGNETSKRQNLMCPVCNVLLGGRYDHEDKMLFCPECKWTYHFKPINRIPKAVRKTDGSTDKGICGCGGCGR